MLQDNIFLKIVEKKIPAKIIHEDDRCVAFHDVNPQAPVHVLIIPRKVIPTHADITPEDRELLGHLHLVAAQLAEQARPGGRLSAGGQLQGAGRPDGAAPAPALARRAGLRLAAGMRDETGHGNSSSRRAHPAAGR